MNRDLEAQLKRAVMNEPVPSDLRERITSDLRSRRRFGSSRLPVFLAAAAAILVMVGVTLVSLRRTEKQAPLVAKVASGDVVGQILKIGFDDHVYCAIDHDFASKQFTTEQMTEKLGGGYAGLVEVAVRSMPAYAVAVGHRCRFEGREFIHLIMRNESDVVSLVVTRKNGETFPKIEAAEKEQAVGGQVYERTWSGHEVGGLETREHLVFVVSSVKGGGSAEVAARLAVPVRDLLSRLES